MVLVDIQPNSHRFLAEIIVKSIAAVFFIGDRNALGRKSLTRKYFEPLTGRVVVFISTCIQHALREHEYGTRTVIRFEGLEVDSKLRSAYLLDLTYYLLDTYKRLETTWNAQIKPRQKAILSIIRTKVLRQAGLDENCNKDAVLPIENPMYNSLDDLAEFEYEVLDTAPLSSQSRQHEHRNLLSSEPGRNENNRGRTIAAGAFNSSPTANLNSSSQTANLPSPTADFNSSSAAVSECDNDSVCSVVSLP